MIQSDGALGRAALGQKDVSMAMPYFLGEPYIIKTQPGGAPQEIQISVEGASFGYTLTWGIDEQAGCGTASFAETETELEFTNTLTFTPNDVWKSPYRVTIFVTDGNYTIRTAVYIYLGVRIVLPSEVSMDDYKIYLADRQFGLGAEISRYVSATFVLKYNDVGTFSLVLDQSDAPLAGWGQEGSDTYGNIILTRNGEPIFWGVATEFERTWDENKDELVISGEDTMKYVRDHLALSKPDRSTETRDDYTDVPIYYTTLYDVRPDPTISAVSYVGSGNDAGDIVNVAGAGASVGSSQRIYKVWITELGADATAPDKFAWLETTTGNTDTDGIKITGKAQSIDNAAVSIMFLETTNHTIGSSTANYWTFTFQQSTETSEEVIKSYVDDNMGSGALSFRAVDGFSVEAVHTPPLGNYARGRARFDNLLELIQDIALPDLSLAEAQRKPVQFYMDGLTFKMREIADLTDTVVLSKDLDTLRKFNYVAKASTGNYLYVGGKGSEGEREIIEWGNDEGSIPQYGLIEKFVDSNSSESITDLYATAIEELVKSQDNTTFEVEPIDKPHMTIIDDYWVGDKVTAIVDGSEFQEIIREATISITNSDGVRITPVLGTPDTRKKELLQLFKTIRKLESRVSGLERR